MGSNSGSEEDLVGYGRVSSKDQNSDLQVDALTAAGCKVMFIDKLSGMQRERPELERALKRLRKGSVLVVWKLARLGRSLQHLLDIIGTIKAAGAELRVLTENIDTTTPIGRFFFHVAGAFGEFTWEQIREAQAAGYVAAKARGKKFGAKPKLSAADLQSAEILLEHGQTTAEVAKAFGVDRSTLWRAMERRNAVTRLPQG